MKKMALLVLILFSTNLFAQDHLKQSQFRAHVYYFEERGLDAWEGYYQADNCNSLFIFDSSTKRIIYYRDKTSNTPTEIFNYRTYSYKEGTYYDGRHHADYIFTINDTKEYYGNNTLSGSVPKLFKLHMEKDGTYIYIERKYGATRYKVDQGAWF